MSRTRRYGFVYSMPFQPSTITSEDAPSPNEKRPGAAEARAATLCASNAGPLVYAGAIASPRRSPGTHAAVRASGVKPSLPSTSDDHTSLYPSSSSSSSHWRCSCKAISGKGMVIP